MSAVVEDLARLGDPEFLSYWAGLRVLVATGGKSVPREVRDEYARVLAEYRRRVEGDS